MAEGAPLLREYAVLSRIEGSNPSRSAKHLSPNFYEFWAFFLVAANTCGICHLGRQAASELKALYPT